MSATEELRQLIDQMKAEQASAATIEALEAVPEDEPDDDLVEAPSADGVRELFAQIALLRIQEAAIKKAQAQLSAAAKVLIGSHHGIKAKGEKLAKVSRGNVVRVRTDTVRELFPPDKYPQLYNVTEEERLLIDTDFKRAVIAENSKELES